MGLDEGSLRSEINRILEGNTFRGSPIHQRLLAYLAEKAISGQAEQLKEYTVAVEGLGRSPAYDPRQDSTVRVHVTRLRQKLAEYYRGEGAGDPVIVNLPKGGFRLRFERADKPAEVLVAPDDSWRVRKPVAILFVCAAALLVAWTVYSAFALGRTRSMASSGSLWTPDLIELWTPFVEAKQPLVVCVGVPVFSRFKMGFFRDPRWTNWDQAHASDTFNLLSSGMHDESASARFAFTGIGEANAAFLIGRLLGTRRPDLTFARSNLVSWETLSGDNVVFIGPPKFNAKLQNLPAAEEQFRIEPDGIRNLRPKSGEPVFLKGRLQGSPGTEPSGESYALITHVPNPAGNGHVLILAGDGLADTLGAAQYVVEPWHAHDLMGRLKSQRGKLPAYYQVLLKVVFRDGLPVKVSYLLHRTLDIQ